MEETANHHRDIWLPPDFLSEEEFMFMHRDNLPRTAFDNSFPASFGSSASSFELRSAVDSLLGSIETQSVRESLLTELTRRLSRSGLRENALSQRNLENSWLQNSALEAAGNWSAGGPLFRNTRNTYGPYQFPSPPSTAVDPWNQIYAAAAAGHAARRKMNALDPLRATRGLVVSPANHRLPPVNNNTGYCTCQCLSHNYPQPNHVVHARQDQALKQICSSIWGRPTREPLYSQQHPIITGERASIGGDLGLPEPPACPYPLDQPRTHRKLPPVRGGSGGKRESAGTGVFIPAPRSYGSHLVPPQKKNVGAVQTPNRNSETMSTTRQQAKPSFNGASPPDYDDEQAAAVQMNAYMQSLKAEGGLGGGGGGSNGVSLPPEWTY